MRYKTNFLATVIFQLKFDPVLALEESPAAFQERISLAYPRVKEGQEFEIETTVSPDKAVETLVKSKKKNWTFHPEGEQKALTISPNQFTISYKKYESNKDTEADFKLLWSAFQSIYAVKTLTRVGLRYINLINLPGDPLDWKGFVQDRLIQAVLGVPPPGGHSWARSLNTIYYSSDDHQIMFQYGLYNSEFPSQVNKKEFVLDFDCYSVGATEASEAAACLMKYNGLIEGLFEGSIEDGLRAVMGIAEETRDRKGGAPA